MRYSRQIFSKSQKKILNDSNVAIIGLGGLGSICAQLLTRAGVGRLTLIDRDKVVLSNLHRQILYSEKHIKKEKAYSSKHVLKSINSEIEIKAENLDLDKTNIEILAGHDLVLGCTDNMESRFLINEFCVRNKIPWINGGATKTYGNLLVVMPKGPCLECVFPRTEKKSKEIVNTIPNIIGAMQVTQAYKVLLNRDYEKDLVYFDAWKNELTKIKIKKKPDCPCRTIL